MAAAHKLPHERIVRLKGHAALYAFGNGVCVKPKCRCGWIGYAAPKTAARHQYIGHLHSAKAAVAKATGEAA